MQIFSAPTVDAAAAESVRQQLMAQHDAASRRTLQAMLDISRVLTSEQRAQIARHLKLVSLPALSAEVTVKPWLDGAEITGRPLWLASALAKIARGAEAIRNPDAERNPATAHLFIINPLSGERMDSLFSTHPATENRIAALQAA